MKILPSKLIDLGTQDLINMDGGGGSVDQYAPEVQLANLIAQGQAQGVEPPQPKESVLQKVARILNVGRAFTAGMEEYGGLGGGVKGVSENLDSAKILQKRLGRELTTAEKSQAFIEDILKDPLTYLTFGTGSGVEVATKEGVQTLTKAGTAALKQAGQEAGTKIATEISDNVAKKVATGKMSSEAADTLVKSLTDADTIANAGAKRAERLFAKKISDGAPEYLKYVDKGGLKLQVPFAGSGEGMTLVSGDKVKQATGAVSNLVRKIPFAGDAIDKTTDFMGKAFVPSYDIKKTISGLRKAGDDESLALAKKMENYLNAFQEYSKGSETEKMLALNRMKTVAAEFDKPTREQIFSLMERMPTSEGTQTATEVLQGIRENSGEMYKAGTKEAKNIQKQIVKVSQLSQLPGMTPEILATLKKKGIRTVDDLIAAYPDQLGKSLDQVVNVEKGARTVTKRIPNGIPVYNMSGGNTAEILGQGTDALGRGGTYVFENPAMADKFTGAAKADFIFTGKKVLDLNTQEDLAQFVKDAIAKYPNLDYQDAMTQLAKSQGYDAIRGSDNISEFMGLHVINPKKLIPAESVGGTFEVGPQSYQYIKSGAQKAGRLKVAAGNAAEDFTDLTYKKIQTEQDLVDSLAQNKKLLQQLRGSTENIEDPQLRQAVEFLQGINKDTAREEAKRGLLTNEVQDYVHRMLTPEAQQAVRATKEGYNGLNKTISTSIRSAGKHRSVLDTVMEAEPKLKELYGVKGDFYIKDPFLTTAIREQTSIGATRAYDFLKDTANKLGRKPVTEQGIKLGWEIDPNTGMKYVTPTNRVMKDAGVMVPEAIAKDVDRYYESLTNVDTLKDVMKGWDTVQNMWKYTVTGPFPAFHVRNMQGAFYNNWLAGVTDLGEYRDADKIVRNIQKYESAASEAEKAAALKTLTDMKFTDKAGKVINAKQLMGMYDVKVGRRAGHTADIVSDMSKELAYKGDTMANIRKAGSVGKTILEATEERVRLPLFLDTWKKTGSFDRAGENVIKFHFDYTPEGMTSFENKVLKRIMPFYRWVRGNIPLQFEQILKQPGKQAAAIRASQAFVDPNLKEQLPDYMQQGTAIQLGPEKNGSVSVLTGFGLPFEDINKLSWREMMNAVSPLIKTPLELTSDYSYFYKKPITDQGGQFAKYYANGPMAAFNPGNWLEIKKVTRPDGTTYYTGNAQKLYAMQQALGRLATTTGKLNDSNASVTARLISGLSGVQATNVDLEQEKYYKSKALLDSYGKSLVNKGVIRSSKEYYVPKGYNIEEIQ